MPLPKALMKLHRHLMVYAVMPIHNRRAGGYYLSHRPSFMGSCDPEKFRALRRAWHVGRASNNRGDWARLYFLIATAEDIAERGVPGAIAELGVYRGASAKVLRLLLPGRPLYLFDTFEGLDQRDLAKGGPVGLFTCPLDEVRAFVGDEPDIHYCPGYFPETARMIPADQRFALVHLDMDLYKPTKEACEHFYDRLEPGGVMILHDYHGRVWPGVKQGVDEFIADKPERLAMIPDKSGTAVLVKNAAPRA